MRVGLISDTHGLLDPKLEELFAGCDLILHGGDVARHVVLEALGRLAPVVAVRGNNDLGPFGESLPATAVVEVGVLRAFLVHELGSPQRPGPSVGRALARAAPDLVLHGHSHRPAAVVHRGILFVNPGSAGPRRFSLPRTAGRLEVVGRRATVELYDLGGVRPRRLGAPFQADL